MCPRACGRRENFYTKDTASTRFSTEDQKAYVFSQKKKIFKSSIEEGSLLRSCY